MKTSLRDKFKQNANFVKPLYRKVKFGNRVKPIKKLCVSVDIKGDTKPCGDGLHVKKDIDTNERVDYNVIEINSENNKPVPGSCDKEFINCYTRFKTHKSDPKLHLKIRKNVPFTFNLLGTDYKKMENENENSKENKSVQVKNSSGLIEKVPETWLRIYPAPQVLDESAVSVIFRCIVCQLGLAAFLILWNILWVFIIHYFEGPYEIEVSILFEKEQNQLVIDLATELRQITPLSPKWKNAIEMRIEDERMLTMQAMARGAKLHPGQFWDLSGTFLFSVYVMTALGFGAPVPQTTGGRTSALVYAILAVPMHIYLMINASTYAITKVESCIKRYKTRIRNKTLSDGRATAFTRERPTYSRNSEPIKNEKSKSSPFRQKLARFLRVLYAGRCVPAAMVVYYACGAIGFGALRSRPTLDIFMFPLEFTTTGGLEHVESHVRILYGFYVEGAMSLLACALATLRADSSATINYMSDKYRLFTINKQ